jgi:molybdopterin molybdotransferase
MVSVEEAKKLLFQQFPIKTLERIDISQSLNKVIAEDIFSPIDQPSFNNSSMDGYALATTDNLSQKTYEVIGEIKAGDTSNYKLTPGQAVRIFTGALVPDSADSIVIQEKVRIENGYIHLNETIKKGAFIRKVGSMMRKGDLALKKGFLLNPAAIGFLASMGIFEVKVYKNPDVTIITTGDEIVKKGMALQTGQIYESNSFSLTASLNQMGIIPKKNLSAKDTKVDLKHQIKVAIELSDIIILTGGISVGKYDLVHDTLMDFKVETLFYKVEQKPGKPFFAGKLGDKYIFALPGNPAAVLVCFYEYIYPLLKTLQGFDKKELINSPKKLLKSIICHEHRAQFMRAFVNDQGVMPLEGQDSFMLYSFAMANALIYIPRGTEKISENELVEVHMLP